MERCRICLINCKDSSSVFDIDKNNLITYADLMMSIADIKITRIENNNERICHQCCENLQDVILFKMQIERSDRILNSTTKSKKINFYNIHHLPIGYGKEEINNNIIPKYREINILFESGQDSIFYNNTVIKKLSSTSPGPITSIKETLPIPKLFDDLEHEDCSNCNGNNSTDIHWPNYENEKLIPLKTNKKKYKRRKYTVTENLNVKKTSKFKPQSIISIKPEFLEDVRLIPSRRKRPIVSCKKLIKRESTRELICPYCGKLSKTMKTHILLHIGEKKFKCSVCLKGFYSENALSSHLKRHSSIYKCDHCIATFDSKPSLQSHLLTHMDVKSHVCKICLKAFKRKGALSRHLLIHSSARKNFKCDLCNMSFYSNYSLKQHTRVHTGERPFKCEICSQEYSYKHDFNKHCFKKHGVTLKRRPIHILNEEVLRRELVKQDVKDHQPLDNIVGPQNVPPAGHSVKTLLIN